MIKFKASDFEEYRNGTIKVEEGIGNIKFDTHLRFKRNFTIIGGNANVGKSTGWLFVLFLFAKIRGLKFLLFMNEDNPKEVMLQLIEWYYQEFITKLSPSQVAVAVEWIEQFFMVMDNDYEIKLNDLLNKCHEIKHSTFDYDGLYLDPYNSIKKDDSYGGHYNNAGMFRKFVKMNDVKVMVSMHPNSEQQRKRSSEDGKSEVPHLTNLEMGSMWFNRCDDGVVIHRQTQVEALKYISEIHVQKVKHKRSGGEPTTFDNPIQLHWREDLGGAFTVGIENLLN